MANLIKRKPGLFERLVDFFLAGRRQRQKAELEALKTRLVAELDSDTMDKILEVLLTGMSLLFLVDKSFRTNIRGFKARYAFTSDDGGIDASVIFKTGWLLGRPVMIVKDHAIENTNITMKFKDGPALAEFLLSPRPDIFSGILDKKLSWSGNLNYILKFIYMARHLPRHYGIALPQFS
jgi:hypothetical protein